MVVAGITEQADEQDQKVGGKRERQCKDCLWLTVLKRNEGISDRGCFRVTRTGHAAKVFHEVGLHAGAQR